MLHVSLSLTNSTCLFMTFPSIEPANLSLLDQHVCSAIQLDCSVFVQLQLGDSTGLIGQSTHRAPNSNSCSPWRVLTLGERTSGSEREFQDPGKMATVVIHSAASCHRQAMSGLSWMALGITPSLSVIKVFVTYILYLYFDLNVNYRCHIINKS